jgi:hypothetical protein
MTAWAVVPLPAKKSRISAFSFDFISPSSYGAFNNCLIKPTGFGKSNISCGKPISIISCIPAPVVADLSFIKSISLSIFQKAFFLSTVFNL